MKITIFILAIALVALTLLPVGVYCSTPSGGYDFTFISVNTNPDKPKIQVATTLQIRMMVKNTGSAIGSVNLTLNIEYPDGTIHIREQEKTLYDINENEIREETFNWISKEKIFGTFKYTVTLVSPDKDRHQFDYYSHPFEVYDPIFDMLTPDVPNFVTLVLASLFTGLVTVLFSYFYTRKRTQTNPTNQLEKRMEESLKRINMEKDLNRSKYSREAFIRLYSQLEGDLSLNLPFSTYLSIYKTFEEIRQLEGPRDGNKDFEKAKESIKETLRLLERKRWRFF